ncbi:thermostable hemolysin [Microbulbifer elongatus]|uniref:thermostable hemolysin n=1 Tax=Microbulbifer elongatus TaxID=86173 RepID=UPI001CFF33B1|nr:thermostable hemolysin [Microbulbifer elongatus]
MAVDVRLQSAIPPRSPSGEAGGCWSAFNLEQNSPVEHRFESAQGRDREAAPITFQLCGTDQRERMAVEGYISAQFQQVYGARLRHFMPWLLSYGKGQKMHGVLGLRRASTAPLFLEHYLNDPVETVLTKKAGVPVGRGDIAEIGNLVATARGGSRLLFLMLAELFAAADLTWAIFTATPEVQHLLQKLTDNQLVLCRADGARLGDELADWGSYYNTSPAVVAINVRAERQRLLTRPLIRELMAVCRPQATVLAQKFLEAGK